MDFFKPTTTNKVGQFIFLTFELFACLYFFIYFIISIINAVEIGSFMAFVELFLNSTFYSFILFGIGKVIDLLYSKNDCKNDIKQKNIETKDVEDKKE